MIKLFTAGPLLALLVALPTLTSGGCPPPDEDGDGYAADVDCDDNDPTVHPGQDEPCVCDGIDQDCNGVVDDHPCETPVCDMLQEGDPCGGDLGECGPGLSCCYPCGVEGCEDVCMPTCYDEWCSGGCPMIP